MSIQLPEICLRGIKTCQPYSLIQANDGTGSFICCGENDGVDRFVQQDKYTLCFKNESLDERTYNDERDLTDIASVILQALSIIQNKRANKD